MSDRPQVTEALPEIAERDAPPEIARIYNDIRTLSGVPMVALIWRHLATVPGVLPAVWDVLGPLFRQGTVQEAAWSAAATSAEPAVLEMSGLSDSDRAVFGVVLDAYNRANPVNFVAVRVLLHAADGGNADTASTRAVPAGRTFVPPQPIGDLPPMVPPAAIPAELRVMIDGLSTDSRIDRGRVVPSLYRHLIGWPDLLREIHGALHPRVASGELAGIVQGLASAMDQEARRLASGLPAPAILGDLPAVRETLDRFSLLIPEMVAIGLLLRRGLEERR
jgi:hypothetical protein